jgi:hypothetical protein
MHQPEAPDKPKGGCIGTGSISFDDHALAPMVSLELNVAMFKSNGSFATGLRNISQTFSAKVTAIPLDIRIFFPSRRMSSSNLLSVRRASWEG